MATSPELLDRMRRAAQLQPRKFVDEEVLDGLPFIFARDPDGYREFRSELAVILKVAVADVRLIGSAKLGFSLHPEHLLRLFGRRSDLDIVVTAADKFDSASLELASRAEDFLLAGDDERRRFKKSKENVFGGFIRPDQLPLACSLSRTWFPQLAGPFRNQMARRYPVKAWLFKSLEHAAILYSAHQRRVQPAIHKMLSLRGEL